MISSQRQDGGDGSTNMQANQMVVHLGIDEKRAREIYQEMNLQLRKDYSLEALDIAKARVADFESRLMPKMAQVDGALEAFADPSFQLLLVEAQKAAASSERPTDYNLLAELLVHRFQKGENRVARAGISIAVEIVDKISDEALLGLTVAHAVSQFTPSSGNIHLGLNILNDLFGKLLYGKLPKGQAWIDHLDILNAVRLNQVGELKKASQYYSEALSGYVDVGIAKSSDSYLQAIKILDDNDLHSALLLVEHALNADYCRLMVPRRDTVRSLSFSKMSIDNGVVLESRQNISEEQVAAIDSVYQLYSTDGGVRQANIDNFMAEWDSRPNLRVVREWWDNIPGAFSITSVGKVLAHSNAQRCDNSLPSMN